MVQPEPFEKDASLWFDDGNIVLAAETTLFRVHRSVLAMNSPVFRDMFSLPQPEGDTESIKGVPDVVPVVHMHDKAVDLSHLLHTIYDRHYYRLNIATTFEKISALLRLSTKYQMVKLRAEVKDHLALCYPTEFDDLLKHYGDDYGESHMEDVLCEFDALQVFAVVRLARETGAAELLPAALYEAAHQDLDDILRGIDQTNDALLLPDDIRACMHGREFLVSTCRGILQEVMKMIASSEMVDKCTKKCHLNMYVRIDSREFDYPHSLTNLCTNPWADSLCVNCRVR
ncbi:hypothetical protein BD410DRAFT_770177 [Rickenella mellea]|uniref:BTB domain-containing protein n=1 Tax=Rickenella mellea TaxID=50990 RepID=A0A4Y7Q4N7_9AGAM|nr:hypothetical protein BD410DRAFT_770177 [Rickenella mellea]